MAVNLALKYSPVVDERLETESVTNIAFNRDYDWVGVQTVRVYSILTSPLNDYARSGLQRYGVPEELQDTVQEMTLTQDKAFTYTIDRGNDIDQMNVKGAGASLDRQLREVIVPHLDAYRLGVLAANAGNSDVTPATRDNAYELFLAGQETMGNSFVPMGGRIAFMTYGFYNLLKLDPSFVQAGNSSEISLVRGIMGYVDGISLIPVPSNRLPGGVQFILVHPMAACAPVQLSEFIIHENPPGISGNLVEGRVYHDTFVLENKRNAIYVSRSTEPDTGDNGGN